VTFWCGFGSADPYLRLLGPAADPTPFFCDFKDAKKINFIFVLKTYSHIIFSLINLFLAKFCVEILFCKHYFRLLNTFMRKRKDPDPGGPKTSGSPTLLLIVDLQGFECNSTSDTVLFIDRYLNTPVQYVQLLSINVRLFRANFTGRVNYRTRKQIRTEPNHSMLVHTPHL
jgi:hypothetical protein